MSDLDKLANEPAKYSTLIQAQTAGLTVPKSLLLDANDLVKNDIVTFLENCSAQDFIVRSANLAEDGSDFSLAGHFWSSEAVSKSSVIDTIRLATEKNSKVLTSLGLENAPQLILQEYIEHKVGGVLFSPWGFFADYVYVEYSETGVKRVVEGQDSVPVVLCTDAQHDDPLSLPETLAQLKPLLTSLCHKLAQVFDFPIDCEWAYNESQQCIVILQVRPQTHLIGPVLPYSRRQKATHTGATSNDSALDDGLWQFTALSESLGRLSPLSFSLLKQLYKDSTATLKLLGCKAENVNFMHYAPDGSVLVDSDLEKQFFQMTLFGGFKRGLQQAKLLTEALQVMSKYQAASAFTYNTLLSLFSSWLAANVLSNGAGRDQVSDDHSAIHGYELSWPTTLSQPIAPDDRSWAAMNSWGRQLFLFELNKLKLVLDNNAQPKLLFCTWTEYSTQEYGLAKHRQHSQAHDALYDHALLSSDANNENQALSSIKSVEGRLFIIAKPSQLSVSIPQECILVAPYFDNRWVTQINALKGIIVNRGSRLSHSAIVAREYGIPYYVMPELDISALKPEQKITLATGKIQITDISV